MLIRIPVIFDQALDQVLDQALDQALDLAFDLVDGATPDGP
jgi:hypothetical protein